MLVENNNFLIDEVPIFHPLDPERVTWWREQRKRMFEGYWVSGKWMPPNLYHYVNFWHILLNESPNSKTKILAKPHLRDLEWDKSFVLMEARGFSGFALDKEFTCDERANPAKHQINQLLGVQIPSFLDGLKYIPARDYLRLYHGYDKGRPLFYNMAKNVMDIECRGTGKSYFAAGNIGWNFITDGHSNYEEYLDARRKDKPYSSECVVGAAQTPFLDDLLSKVKVGLDNYEGGVMYEGTYHPSPTAYQYMGEWKSGKTVRAEYDVKEGGTWKRYGTRSKIQPRVFENNPTAANGTRPNFSVIEEVGFMGNLVEVLGKMKEATRDGNKKFGSIWMMGTGGQMKSGQTRAAKKVFYNPEGYDCLAFEDEWEHTGKVSYFIPVTKKFDEFRDKEGVIDEKRAAIQVQLDREQAKSTNDQTVYNEEIENNPLVPTEAFLDTAGNVFPVADLKEQKQFLESEIGVNFSGLHGHMVIDATTGFPTFKPDLTGTIQPVPFPVEKGVDITGCVTVWEAPETESDGTVRHGLYIASTDPYDQDQAENTQSLGSTLIYKRYNNDGTPADYLVAEYTGRPMLAKDHHEQVKRLLMWYNAKDLYENERNTMKMYFEQQGVLYLLAESPTILDSLQNTTVSRRYGIHMTKQIKKELVLLAKDWLLTPKGDGKLNLHYIFSIGLLQELIDYNEEVGNYDRVIAFILVILYKNQLFRNKIVAAKKVEEDRFLKSILTGQIDHSPVNIHDIFSRL